MHERRENQQVAEDEYDRPDPAREFEQAVAAAGRCLLRAARQYGGRGNERPQDDECRSGRNLVAWELEPRPIRLQQLEEVRPDQCEQSDDDQGERDQQLHAANPAPPLARAVRHGVARQADVCRHRQHQAEDADRERKEPGQPGVQGARRHRERMRRHAHDERAQRAGGQRRRHDHDADGGHATQRRVETLRSPPPQPRDETDSPRRSVAKPAGDGGPARLGHSEVGVSRLGPHRGAHQPDRDESRYDHRGVHRELIDARRTRSRGGGRARRPLRVRHADRNG